MVPITSAPGIANCSVNNVDMCFQIDIGSDISTISCVDDNKLSEVESTTQKAVGYSGKSIDVRF